MSTSRNAAVRGSRAALVAGAALLACEALIAQEVPPQDGTADREHTVSVLVRIADPVLTALSQQQLKATFPVHEWEQSRAAFTHYEAFARTLAGIAPWLELGPDTTPEGQERARMIELARLSLINATDPASADYLNFTDEQGDQPLVEHAYLAFALLRAPTQLFGALDPAQQENVLNALRMAREIEQTHNNNWHLFPAMVEAALWQLTGEADIELIEDAVELFEDEWYLGDGVYGDGPEFSWDYYNSYVIHPMLLEVLTVAEQQGHPLAEHLPLARARGQRYAEVLERMVSPEGTFPVIGRSSAYRFAVFFHLGYMALRRELPASVDPAAARGAITTVVRRMTEAPGTFDPQGWLTLGAVGAQPSLQEVYNATGSLYVTLTGLVHLGLPADDPFWTLPPFPWTQQRIWAGEDIALDHNLEDELDDLENPPANPE